MMMVDSLQAKKAVLGAGGFGRTSKEWCWTAADPRVLTEGRGRGATAQGE